MPPMKNAVIENIYGRTGDDMISFTLGDYEAYEISNEGDFENIIIRDVFSNNSKAILKFTGSGKDGLYKFKNISVNNIFGTVERQTAFIMDDTNLVGTRVEGITFRNINTNGNSNGVVFFRNTGGGDATIENVRTDGSSGILTVSDMTILDKLTVKNVNADNDMLKCFTIAGVVNNIILENIKVINYGGNKFLELGATSKNVTLRDIFVENKNKNSSICIHIKNNSNIGAFKADNIEILNFNYGIYIQTSIALLIVNSSFFGTSLYINGTNIKCRITGANNAMDDMMSPYYSGENNTCEINDMTWKANHTKVTGVTSDFIFNTIANNSLIPPLKVGIAIFDGTQYKNLF